MHLTEMYLVMTVSDTYFGSAQLTMQPSFKLSLKTYLALTLQTDTIEQLLHITLERCEEKKLLLLARR